MLKRLLPLVATMRKQLCANRWRQSVKLRSKPQLNSRRKTKSVLNKKRVARRRRNKRSVVKKRNVSVSHRKRLNARPQRIKRLKRCAPNSNSRCRWRSNRRISS